MSDPGQRWLEVRAQIDAAAVAAGRAPQDVALIAVSKRHSARAVAAAFEAGARDFGENYVQELAQKRVEVAALLGERARALRWHVIGHVQTNKVKDLGEVALLHTVDRDGLLAQLGRRGQGVQGALVQVHIGGEERKEGVAPEALAETLRRWWPTRPCALRGLMCIPPPRGDEAAQRADFAALRACLEEARAALGAEGAALTELSMGMSADFGAAIAEGATMVRVGTAIFGERST
jgi:pyridoxal phosphate enzyme (YggS family)